MRAGRRAPVRVHDLRAANATVLVAGGVDAKEVQRRLRHASLRMTLGIYARAVPEGDARAALRLDRLLHPDGAGERTGADLGQGSPG